MLETVVLQWSHRWPVYAGFLRTARCSITGGAHRKVMHQNQQKQAVLQSFKPVTLCLFYLFLQFIIFLGWFERFWDFALFLLCVSLMLLTVECLIQLFVSCFLAVKHVWSFISPIKNLITNSPSFQVNVSLKCSC